MCSSKRQNRAGRPGHGHALTPHRARPAPGATHEEFAHFRSHTHSVTGLDTVAQ